MPRDLSGTLRDCLKSLVRPALRFCIRRSLGLQDLIEVSKIVLIELAIEELEKSGERVNMARISAITGVHRKDVARIYKEGETKEGNTRFTGRLIERWRRDPKYTTKSNKPRVLTFDSEDSEFAELVAEVSLDLHPSVILFDLERIGAVTRTRNGLKLNAHAYIPTKYPEDGLQLLADDAEDLMTGIMQNIFAEDKDDLPNYHAKAYYDNLSRKDLPAIKEWLFDQCYRFQERVLKYLAKYDLDVNPNSRKKGGGKLTLGIFTCSEETDL